MDVFVGTDIESVSRIKNIINRKDDYLNHLFYKSELDYSFKRNNPECTLTGIWCAKEAVLKAMSPIVTLSLQDIEILNVKDSKPKVKINKKLEFLYSISVSFAHTKEYATATALFILK